MALYAAPLRRPAQAYFDVDDTVAPSTRPLEPGMAAALAALHAKGTGLVFVSGASVAQMQGQVSERLGLPHVLLGTSGSHAVQADAGGAFRELFKSGFSPQESGEIRAALQALVRHFHIRSDTDDADQLQDRGCQFTLSALGRGAESGRKRAFDPDGSLRREWVRFLQARLGDDRFSMRVGGTTSIDITARGVDKASGLRRLIGMLGYRAEDGLYFGDRFEETGNDHPVLSLMDCVRVQGPEQTLTFIQNICVL